MTNRALVIQESQIQSFNNEAFFAARNLVAEYCNSSAAALSALQLVRYRCVLVSTDMKWENPVAIICALRHAEKEFGLTPTQIVVIGKSHLFTQAEMSKLKISAQIHSHLLK